MNWTDIAGPLIKAGLTGLGTAFGGPLGGTVGGALGQAIAGALGTDPTPEAVSAAIQADPAIAAAKLKDLESARQAELAELQAILTDKQDARHMEIELVKEGSAIAWAPVVVSIIILLIDVGLLVGVSLGKLAEGGNLVGWGLASGTLVMSYWLGSSNGSRRNGDAVRNIAQQAARSSARKMLGT